MGESAKTGSEEFGDMLRRARERLGMSRRELAEGTGLSYPYISQLETGYRMPSSPAMRSLADALGLRPDDLFDAIPPSSPRDEQTTKAPAFDDVRSRATAAPVGPAAVEPAALHGPRAERRRGGSTTPTAAGAGPGALPPAPAATPPVPAAGGGPSHPARGIAEVRGWIDNERFGSTASSDAGSGVPMVDALLLTGAAATEPGPDPVLVVDEATVLLTSLPTAHRLAALGQVQDRVVRSVVEDRLRDAGRPV